MTTNGAIVRAAVVSLTLVLGARLIARAEQTEPVPIRAPFAEFPMKIAEWQGFRQPALDPDVLRVLGVDDYLTRAYVAPTRAGVGLYVGYWSSQKEGDSIHSPLNCLPGSGWEPTSSGRINVALDGVHPVSINRYIVQKGLDRLLVLYWYQSHGRTIASEYWGKFYLVADSIRLHRTDATIVRITVPVVADSSAEELASERVAVQFAQQLTPVLSKYLP
jgi:EpsI family protein